MMTSCSCQYVSLSSRRTILFHHHRRKLLLNGINRQSFTTAIIFNKNALEHPHSLSSYSSKELNKEKENGNQLKDNRGEVGFLNKSSNSLSSRVKMFSLPRLLNVDLFSVKNNFQSALLDSEVHINSKQVPVLCYLSPSPSLKIAPGVFRNISGVKGNRDDMPNVGKVSSSFPLESGESSWKPFSGTGSKFSDINNVNNKFISQFRPEMSLSLLLDPVIGSPPSNLPSPLVEARDDISTLSQGFTRKPKLLRRRLSTSFDEPTSPSILRAASSEAKTEHGGPLGLKGSGRSPTRNQEEAVDSVEKKAALNAWLSKLYEETVKTQSSVSESNESDSGGNVKDSSGGDDSNQSSRKSSGQKISEDLFQLLEKVIGFKGRNISHITVEQSVKDLCTIYMDASEDEKLKFFTILAEKYGVDHDNVTSIATSLASCRDGDAKLTLEEKLRGALVPKSQWLFTQIGRLENGVKFLVDMRTDLLDATGKADEKSALKALNNSLRDLIGMWFNVGFLNLERVTWQSSCDMLQKISEYEAVHPMRNWTDLKKRVGPNRRCFVFTHNSMPGEPVVVLHTFLTDHIPSSVQKIVANHRLRMMSLDNDLPMTSHAENPDSISTAAFYSITSTQRGLTGIELGNYLIKRVVRELQSEFPKMSQFSSLSPIPGFKKWLVGALKNASKESNHTLLTSQELEALKPIFDANDEGKNLYEVFLDLLKLNAWFSDDKLVKALEKPLMRLCAQYLYIVKRRGYALDPVAHFHLKNGAVMWRLNWLADNSPRGLGQSCGMMVNYRYFLDDCETNSQNYMENHFINISDQVKHLVKLSDSKL